MTPVVALQLSIKFITDWQNSREIMRIAQGHQRVRTDSVVIRWKKPEEYRLKLNVDASVLSGAQSYAIRMIIRDHGGRFIQAKSVRYPGTIPVLEAEARGVLEATKWIQSLQLQNVDIETDSQLTVHALLRGI